MLATFTIAIETKCYETGTQDTMIQDGNLRSPSSAVSADDGLIRFFLLTFVITFALQMPGVLAQKGILPWGEDVYMPFVVLGVFGPLFAAWITSRRLGGKAAVRQLFQSLYSSPPGIGWMLAALACPGVLLSAALLAHRAMGGDGPLAYPPEPAGRIVAALLIAVGEEVGWRGFALPRLAKRIGRLSASAALGIIWTFWHLPMFMGQRIPLALMPLMLVFFTGGSILFSWFYFRTRGSLLIAVLLHIGVHLNNSHLPLPGSTTPLMLHTVALLLSAGALVAIDRRTFFPRTT